MTLASEQTRKQRAVEVSPVAPLIAAYVAAATVLPGQACRWYPSKRLVRDLFENSAPGAPPTRCVDPNDGSGHVPGADDSSVSCAPST